MVFGLALFFVSLWKFLVAPPVPRVPVVAAPPSDDPDRGPLAGVPAIVIDPGHGGIDGGTVANGLVERDLTLPIARELAAVLERRGWTVRLTRTTDTTVDLQERSAFANAGLTRVFVSVHVNAGPAPVEGVETFYSAPKSLSAAAAGRAEFRVGAGVEFDDSRGELLAQAVQEAVCARTGARDRGVKNRAGLAVTRHTNAPAILVECGFLSNADEAVRLADAGYQRELAEGIATGIEAYLDRVAQDPSFGVRIGPAEASLVDGR